MDDWRSLALIRDQNENDRFIRSIMNIATKKDYLVRKRELVLTFLPDSVGYPDHQYEVSDLFLRFVIALERKSCNQEWKQSINKETCRVIKNGTKVSIRKQSVIKNGSKV